MIFLQHLIIIIGLERAPIHDYKLESAEEIYGLNGYFQKSGVWKGKEIDTFVLPEMVLGNGAKEKK